MIEIDGSEGEGGGQILRSALALSILTGRPFKLVNIRANRSKPGLQPQHLMCVRAAGTICGRDLQGRVGRLGRAVLRAGRGQAGKYTFSIGTAGATTLVLHTVYLPLALRGDAPSEITITGGTHNAARPVLPLPRNDLGRVPGPAGHSRSNWRWSGPASTRAAAARFAP